MYEALKYHIFCVSCFHEDLWDEIKEDAEADWKAFKESFNNGIQNVEKEVKEDWDVVKDVAKEDWKVVKEEAKEDWNKLDLDWNKLALSDSKVVPGENAESEEAESEGKTSPQAKHHKPSLLITSLTILLLWLLSRDNFFVLSLQNLSNQRFYH